MNSNYSFFFLLENRCEERQKKEGESGGKERSEEEEYLIDESKLGPPFGIVINGHSLVSWLILATPPPPLFK